MLRAAFALVGQTVVPHYAVGIGYAALAVVIT
jgi:hypothetical protein